jgi:Dolichyl-phosphate-mannose-protein mannosyltransferase
VRAMAYGPAAAYLGTHERSGLAFVGGVVHQYRATGWARPFKEDWDSGDAAGLRHYHPPVGLYPIELLLAAGCTNESTLRRVPALTSALACVAATLLAWSLWPSASTATRATAAATAGLLAATSPLHLQGGVELGAHAMFSLWSTLTLLALTRFEASESRAWWRFVWVAMGVTMLTLPYWALLLPPIVWVGWRARGRSDRAALASEAGLVLVATLVVVWPPYLLAAGFVKPFLMYGGLLLRPLPAHGQGTLVLQLVTGTNAILVGALALLAVAVLSRRVRALVAPVVPLVLFCCGFALLNVRVSHLKPLYAGDVVAAASALAAAVIIALPSRAALVGLAVPLVLLVQAARIQPADAPPWREPMTALADRLAGQRVLVTPRPAGAMMAYYLKRSQVILDSSDPADVSELWRLTDHGGIDVVLRLGTHPESGGLIDRRPPLGAPSGVTSLGTAEATWWRLR